MNCWHCLDCGWLGAHVVVPHGGRRRFTRPSSCNRCGGLRLELTHPQHHPRFSHRCACGAWFDAGIFATECLKCRGKHASERAWRTRTGRGQKKYDWTPERDQLLRTRYNSRIKGRVAELARTLGWPGWVVKKRAIQIGVASKVMRRIEWTPAHLEVLEEWTGARTSRWIARRLSKQFGIRFSEQSVINKQKRMNWSRRVRQDGYTLGELEACLGLDHRLIVRLVEAGKLRGTRRGTNRVDKQGDIWEFHEKDVLNFLRDHRNAYSLTRVDQDWFLGFVLPPRRESQDVA